MARELAAAKATIKRMETSTRRASGAADARDARVELAEALRVNENVKREMRETVHESSRWQSQATKLQSQVTELQSQMQSQMTELAEQVLKEQEAAAHLMSELASTKKELGIARST